MFSFCKIIYHRKVFWIVCLVFNFSKIYSDKIAWIGYLVFLFYSRFISDYSFFFEFRCPLFGGMNSIMFNLLLPLWNEQEKVPGWSVVFFMEFFSFYQAVRNLWGWNQGISKITRSRPPASSEHSTWTCSPGNHGKPGWTNKAK